MKIRSIRNTAIIITVLLSGPTLAGKGGGGMGGMQHQKQFERASGQDIATQRRSADAALQRNRDRERYRGPDAERDRQKAKAGAFGENNSAGDQFRYRNRHQLSDN